jgi:hypothetical protein
MDNLKNDELDCTRLRDWIGFPAFIVVSGFAISGPSRAFIAFEFGWSEG